MELTSKNEQQPRYLQYLSFLYFLSSIFFLGALIPFHRTVWLSLLGGAVLAMPFILIAYQLIAHLHSSKLFFFIASLLAACLCAITLYCFSQFLTACVLQELPIWLFPTGFLLCCIYAASKSIYVLERFSKLCGSFILFLLFVALCSGISKIRMSTAYGFFAWKDFLPSSIETIFQESIFFAGLFLAEEWIVMTLFHRKIKTLTVFKSTVKGFSLSILFLSATYLVTVLALGPSVFELLTYPVYYPPGLTGTAEYLERIEVILLAVFVFCEFVKVSLCLMVIKETLLLFFPPKNRENNMPKQVS